MSRPHMTRKGIQDLEEKGLVTVVHLYTMDHKKVASVAIPPFKKLPEILVWGTRTFTLNKTDGYVEGMAFHVQELAFFGTVEE